MRFRVLLALLALLVAGACRETKTTAPEFLTMTMGGGDGQTAEVGSQVGTAPSVRITNSIGQGVVSVPVTFEVASGGGSVTGGTVATDADGRAAAGSWTLGAVAGENTLTASSNDPRVQGGPLTFIATGTAGAAAIIEMAGGDDQTVPVGQPVPVPPQVRVSDAFGNPVAGIGIDFAVTAGGGSVTGASQTTNSFGEASVGGWTLGSMAGANNLTATAAAPGISGNPVTFTATGVAGPVPNGPHPGRRIGQRDDHHQQAVTHGR